MTAILRGKKPIFVRVKVCSDTFSKGLGIMFRKRPLEKDECLLFSFDRELPREFLGIHMHWCFFPITVAWLDSKGKVIDSVRAVPAELFKPASWKVYYPRKGGAKWIVECSDKVRLKKGEKFGIK